VSVYYSDDQVTLHLGVEATCCGQPFRIGADARSPFSFPHVFHIEEAVLLA